MTPITPTTNLEKYDGLEPVEAVLFAWTYPGRRPDWHERRKDEIRRSMPLLARALDRLARGEADRVARLGRLGDRVEGT